ncbi:hypothetical protein ACTMSW_16780 [Micromonospora sp. BQ11]|uniref:hypothetical protein n=1 Tax=Micromonospora sp. BQ11 TaxID=3452212 RepID=UPI003F89E6AB
MTGRTTVDLLSLEDFHRTLTHRLAEAERALRKLNSEMQCRPPALGSFADATDNARRYSEIHQVYVDHVDRLRTAVQAARTATATILASYRTTEARNAANAADIAAALRGVDEALPREEDPRV